MRLTDRAFRYLGNGLILSQEDKLQAEVSLTEARQKAQTCREWIQVGLAYLELGTPQEAAASFAKAEELDPQNPPKLCSTCGRTIPKRLWPLSILSRAASI